MPVDITTSGPDLGTIQIFSRETTAAEINRILRSALPSAVALAPLPDNTVRKASKTGQRHISIRKSHFTTPANPRDPSPSGGFGNRAPHAAIVHEGRGTIVVPRNAPMSWEVSGFARQRVGVAVSRFRRRADFDPGTDRTIVTTTSRGTPARPWMVIAYNRAIDKRSAINRVVKMSEKRQRLF